jgi:hypothetical protein
MKKTFIITVDADEFGDMTGSAIGEALTDAGIEGRICEMQADSVYSLLEECIEDLWDSTLAEQLALEATTANVADIARVPLMQLANVLKAGPNAVRLYHEVTAIADAANFAPDPTRF